MKTLRQTLKLSVMVICLFTLGSFVPQLRSAPPAQNPDNTKTNQRDRSKAEPTADQQKENGGDRELARKVRQSVVNDKSLSTYAHNVKVITQNGQVTLAGPVRSEEGKKLVEAAAAGIAGADKVTSQLQITPKQ